MSKSSQIDPMDADTNGLGEDPAEEMRHCDGCGEDYNAFEESHVGHVVPCDWCGAALSSPKPRECVNPEHGRTVHKMTDAEADAVLTLVRGGWLKFELGDWARG